MNRLLQFLGRHKQLLLLAAVVAAFLITWKFLPAAELIDRLHTSIDQYGRYGILVFSLAFALLKIVGAPNTPFFLAAGMFFSLLEGLVAAVVGALSGSIICFIISRRFAGEWARAKTKRFSYGETLIEAVNQGGFRVMLLARLNPLVPGSIKDYGFGTTRVSLFSYAAATLIGQIPIAFTYVYLAWSGMTTLSHREPWSWTRITLMAAGVVISIVLVWMLSTYASRVMDCSDRDDGKSNETPDERKPPGQRLGWKPLS